ncbi:MAG: endonuclease/exonuclease/phosphatase family protein [Opitutales bacterium]|nr:endonuclease/exonuclease/phosphatase family protein [Opitutales bacterium]
MKIATFNTWKNDGNYPERLKSMAALLKQGDYDVVLLQEVLGADEIDIHTGKYLAKECGFQILEAPSRRKERLVGDHRIICNAGLTTLTKLKPGNMIIHELPSSPTGGERIVQFANLDFEGTSFVIGNIHLSHVRFESEIKKQQWQEAVTKSFEQWPNLPLLIGGDMNTDLDAEDQIKLFEVEGLQIIDTFKAATDSGWRSTHPVPDRSDRPGRRIDTIFSVTKNDQKQSFKFLKSQILGKEIPPNCNAYPSDHALVEIQLQLDS